LQQDAPGCGGSSSRAGCPATYACRPKPPSHVELADLWCADFKGEFKLGNGPLQLPPHGTDQAARFLLMCEALDTTREELAITAVKRLCADRGLPVKIAVWWLRLGRSSGAEAAAWAG